MSFLTGTSAELLYASTARGTEKNTFTSEVLINDTAGMGVQYHLPPDFFTPATVSNGRGLLIRAMGYVGSTGTPTFTITIRGGTAGSTTAAILLGSQALTTASGAVTQPWWLEGTVFMRSIGAAGANSSIHGEGYILSPGFTGTQSGMSRVCAGAAANGSDGVATTFDTSIANYLNFNAACSASSASNKIRVERLEVYGLN